jgi:hypothetical protein
MDANAFPIQLPRDIGILEVPGRIVAETPAWIGHIPFAFWIVSAAEPRVLAELGTHYGNSYFAFAQAVRNRGLATSMFSIDTWSGDEHSGDYGSEVFESVSTHNERNYSSFSQLVRSTFEDAKDHFQDGTIDILHVDGHHTYEAVRGDFDAWLPKMSDRGIVLFHDISVRERGFGVYQLWAELEDQYDSFDFEHAHGLGVLGVGSRIPSLVRMLLSLGRESEEADAVRQLFAILGRRLMLESTLEGQLAVVRSEGEVAMASMRAEYENAMALADAAHTLNLEEVRGDHAAEIELLSRDHAAEIELLRVDTDQMVAAHRIEIDLSEQRAAKMFDDRLRTTTDNVQDR